MSTTQTKKLSAAMVVQSIADTDKIPIVNSSGQTVLVPLSGLLGAIKVGARNLVRSTIYSASVPGARRTNGRIITADNNDNHRINLVHNLEKAGYYAVSFWAKSSNGSKTFRIDVNDSEAPALKNLSVDSSWQFFSGVIYVSYNLGVYGFIDFFQADGVVISDLSVVEGSVPLQEWIPAPEDWGG